MPGPKTTIYFLRLDYHDGSVGAYDAFAVQDQWKVQEVDGLPGNKYCCQDMESAHAARLFSVRRGVFVRSDGSSGGPETTELRIEHHHKREPDVFFFGQIKLCPFCGGAIDLVEGLQAKSTREDSRVDVLREVYSTSAGQQLLARVYVDGWLATERKAPE